MNPRTFVSNFPPAPTTNVGRVSFTPPGPTAVEVTFFPVVNPGMVNSAGLATDVVTTMGSFTVPTAVLTTTFLRTGVPGFTVPTTTVPVLSCAPVATTVG